MEKQTNKKRAITKHLRLNRVNKFMEFLIILNDEDYKKNCICPSTYDKLCKQNFPGEILILHKDDLKLEEYSHIKIDSVIAIKKLYLKLHKEDFYVDATKYQEKLIESTTNEFMRIIFTLNAEHIQLKMSNDNIDNLGSYFKSSLNIKKLDVNIGVVNENNNASHRDNEFESNFANRNKHIDATIFLDKEIFYYLPNHPEWNEVIRNRLTYCAKDCHYVYHYTDSHDISSEFIAKLQVLNIDFNYDKKKYDNFSLEYNITYYPLIQSDIEFYENIDFCFAESICGDSNNNDISSKKNIFTHLYECFTCS